MDDSGFGGSTSVTPAEFKILQQRYLEERGRDMPDPLDEAKLQARQRTASNGVASS